MFDSQLVDNLGRMRRCGLVGGVVFLWVGFEALKVHVRPGLALCFQLAYQDVSSQSLSQHHVCLPAVLLPTVIVMASDPLELRSPN